jgi:hypothetical protein
MPTNMIAIDPRESADPALAAENAGTVVKLDVTDPNIADIIRMGFDRLSVERSTDGGLTYSEISVPSERPLLESAETVMTFFDRSGHESYWYRFRYINTKTSDLSEPSPAVLGEGLLIRQFLTVEQLKARYFFGIDITDDQGNPMPDATFQHFILQAIRWMEHQIDISILPQSFVEKHDYHRLDYEAFQFLQLDNYPVLSVEELSVQYPSGQNVVVFPQEWLRLNGEGGQLQVVPTAGTLSEFLIGQGGTFLPAIYHGMHFLPQLFSVQYTAGFEEGKVPSNIIDLIGMFASLGPFHVFGDLIVGAGIANISLSMDGLSQSIGSTSSATNAGYGARILNYLKQIKEQIPLLRRYYKGVRMVVA